MDRSEFMEIMAHGQPLIPGTEAMAFMQERAAEVRLLTQAYNSTVAGPEERRRTLADITQEPVDDSVMVLPPLTVDCGVNLHLGRNIFINTGCSFQDQGGIWLGDGALIGHNAVFATLNHDEDPAQRGILHPAPIVVEENVWIGANATILGGVTIGEGAIVAAGAVVTSDVPAGHVVAGVPARVIRPVRAADTQED